jgi:hypothetical protein
MPQESSPGGPSFSYEPAPGCYPHRDSPQRLSLDEGVLPVVAPAVLDLEGQSNG